MVELLVWRLQLALIPSKAGGLVPSLLLTTLLSSSGLKSSVSWLPLKTWSRDNLVLNLKENLKALHCWQLSGWDLHQQLKCLGKGREKMESLVPYLELEQFVLWNTFRCPSERKVKGLLWRCGRCCFFFFGWLVSDWEEFHRFCAT